MTLNFRRISYIGGAFIIIGVPLLVRSNYLFHLLILSGIYVLLCLSLNLLMGYTGQVSLAPQSFYAIGAYTAGLLAVTFNLPFVINFAAAGFTAGIVGIILGLPAIRLGGHYLAITTLGFSIIVEIIIQNWDSVTRGFAGLTGVKPPTIPILGYRFSSKLSYYFLMLFLLLLCLYFFYRLTSSKTGRAFRAIKEDETAAQASGIHTTYYKLLAFGISSLLAGFGGAFYAQYILFVSPELGGITELINIYAMTIVGGIGTIAGSIIGAVFLTFLPEMMREVRDYRLILYGVMLVVMIIFMPGGIWSFVIKFAPFLGPISAISEKKHGQQKTVLFESAGIQNKTETPSFSRGTNEILELDRVSKSFSGLRANHEISLKVREGEILSIIGPNGSGKTTLLNVISGYYPKDSGSIKFCGERIDGLRPDQIASLGLRRTFQRSRLFHNMTLQENLLVGMHLNCEFSLLDELFNTRKKHCVEQKLFHKAIKQLEEFDLSLRWNEGARNLPFGLQRIVEILMAVSSDPKLLLLDEPAAGMNLQEIERLKTLLKLLQRKGITIVLVEHVMDVVMDISDFIIVLDYGERIAYGSPAEIQSNLQVRKAYLGAI
jgi:ABC-type branched-subunit amino acid transport system ATPase component/ABC-type branched-subunit amino acid transport system permease subunit